MAAPIHGSWVRGRLYLAPDDTAAAQPLTQTIDFSFDAGLANEERPFTGARVTPRISLLSSPSIAINYNRLSTQEVVWDAARHWRANGTGVRFYLYLDTTSEATVYAYGLAGLEGVSLAGGAAAAMAGTFTLVPAEDGQTWDDTALVA